MTFKKKHKIAIGILSVLLVAIIFSNYVITKIISDKVVELLKNQHVENVHISIGSTKFNLFDRSLVFRELHLSPSDTALAKLKRNELKKNTLQKISVSRLKFKGIHLTTLILNKDLTINKLIIDDPVLQFFKNNQVPPKNSEGKSVRLDSIHLKDLNGFSLETISLTNFRIQLIDVHEGKITFQNKPLDFEVTGISLEEVSEHTFKLTTFKESFSIKNLKIELPNIKYEFSIAELDYLYDDKHLQISGLRYKPMVNKLTLANSYTYNYDVYNLGVNNLRVYNLNTDKIIHNQGIFIDSILVDGLSLDVYKDKRKPFDLNKRPKFPHEALKQMETPLMIDKISVINSDLTYEERLENKDILMKATMNDLSANCFNVTSIEEYRKSPMKIDLNCKLMGKANLNLDMILPLADGENTFFFSGYLGKSRMTYYDTAIIPALGLKVLEGEIESLSFTGSADNLTSNGTMKFRYHDLEAEVFKHKNTEKSGFLSWSVNNLIHKSNPGPNGQLREAIMNFERVEYKGFGNFLWKTIQSGIVNSIAPFGKTSEKVDAKKKRQLKREERRKKRQD